jgi:4-hydroxy-4-methyl-2-oxoglutarate aldolase
VQEQAAERADGRSLALVDRLGSLNVAVVCDILDALGVDGRIMDARIRPLDPRAKLAGYAATCHVSPVAGPPKDRADAYAGELAAIDALERGDVLVVAGADEPAAFWGELLANAARHRGGVGVVGEARARDVGRVLDLGFPAFVTGIDPRDSYGRLEVDAIGETVSCAGVDVAPGDLVIGDHDGVVAIPGSLAERVVREAEEKVAREAEMRASLRAGMPVTEAFAHYGIL